MNESTPRKLPERTGRHLCTRCLAEVAGEEYFANDHLCSKCAEDGDYPLASTPGHDPHTDTRNDPK